MDITPADVPVLTTDDAVLDYTRDIRIRIVHELLGGGKAPDDKDTQNFLMKALDGLDRSAISKLRMQADKSISADSLEAAGLLSEIYGMIGYKTEAPPIEGRANRVMTLPSTVPAPDLVPGELDGTTVQENYTQFMARTTPKLKE